MKNNFEGMSKRDQETMEKITKTVKQKTKQRVYELHSQGYDVDHVQINYFNIKNLGRKHKVPEASTAMNWGDCVVQDEVTGLHYLCVIVSFDTKQMDINTFKMLIGISPRIHDWEYSDEDHLFIDKLAAYVDKVEIEKAGENEDGSGTL